MKDSFKLFLACSFLGFFYFDKDSSSCSHEIGSYPIIRKLQDRLPNAPKQGYHIDNSDRYTRVKWNNTQKLSDPISQ